MIATHSFRVGRERRHREPGRDHFSDLIEKWVDQTGESGEGNESESRSRRGVNFSSEILLIIVMTSQSWQYIVAFFSKLLCLFFMWTEHETSFLHVYKLEILHHL